MRVCAGDGKAPGVAFPRELGCRDLRRSSHRHPPEYVRVDRERRAIQQTFREEAGRVQANIDRDEPALMQPIARAGWWVTAARILRQNHSGAWTASFSAGLPAKCPDVGFNGAFRKVVRDADVKSRAIKIRGLLAIRHFDEARAFRAAAREASREAIAPAMLASCSQPETEEQRNLIDAVSDGSPFGEERRERTRQLGW